MRFFLSPEYCVELRNKPNILSRLIPINKRDEYEYRCCSEVFYNQNYGDTSGTWRSRGKDHVTLDTSIGMIRRTIETERKGYAVDIESLEDLFDFINDVGLNVVISLGHPDPTICR